MKKIILILVIIFLLVGVNIVTSIEAEKEKSQTYPTYTVHDPIYIEGNDDFISENGVTDGSGTSNDPYIIEGWDINASSQHGITIVRTNVYFKIRNCYIHNGGTNKDGIVFKNVTNGKIINSVISNNRYGIIFRQYYDYPWEDSSYNFIYSNTIINNKKDGIHFEHLGCSYHSYNHIFLNIISGNDQGIYMIMSDSNLIYSNNIISNLRWGVNLTMCMGGGSYNKVYHNNFIENEEGQACVWWTLDNYWDNGYPSGGNFWSDYIGEDNDGDGIGDTPYEILVYDEYENDYDYYPLIEPYGENLPPFADFYWIPKLPDSNETIIFNASNSVDYDGYITLYEWDWDNDGEYDENTTDPETTFIFDDAGDYSITLQVHDNNSLNDTITKMIRIGNRPPNEPILIYPLNESINVPLISNLLWSGDDPDGDIVTFDVLFGKNSPPPKIVSNQSGTTYYTGGLDDCTLYYWKIVVWDEYGTSSEGPIWSFTTTCKPDAPIITGPTNGKPGISYLYTFTSALDPDGDEVSYFIDWGDSSNSGWTFYIPSGPPGYSESHSWSSEGNYTIKAKIKDIFGIESDWSEFTVTMPRAKPLSNLPLLRFLERYPILNFLLQRLLIL